MQASSSAAVCQLLNLAWNNHMNNDRFMIRIWKWCFKYVICILRSGLLHLYFTVRSHPCMRLSQQYPPPILFTLNAVLTAAHTLKKSIFLNKEGDPALQDGPLLMVRCGPVWGFRDELSNPLCSYLLSEARSTLANTSSSQNSPPSWQSRPCW